ncbi:hypothetical protein D0Y65_005161 [Glycine soja]|uniref:Uncharacterized protein n=1 Tax=Glycine soja TaxID=3848 RepID=A0A445LUG6_GLYSO|nr:hypothetical protein D0Y65_005161 [Glycine soja]
MEPRNSATCTPPSRCDPSCAQLTPESCTPRSCPLPPRLGFGNEEGFCFLFAMRAKVSSIFHCCFAHVLCLLCFY